MEKMNTPITFTCPGCKENFDFDPVGEYQLVPCPICGIDLMTIRKGQTLLLETFKFYPDETSRIIEQSEVSTVES